MSATPIPRSLNMALSGILDVSILSKAPLMRK
jgi:transcription-repair coupling factor (superfamily II helicase)